MNLGELSESGVRSLRDDHRPVFQRSSSDVFIMSAPESLGDLVYIHLWHDNKVDDWYVR